MGMKKLNKKALESKVVVILIITMIVLLVLFVFSGKAFQWLNKLLDKLFGF